MKIDTQRCNNFYVCYMQFEIFGDKGKHARVAVGTNALPLNVCIEIDAIVEFE